MFRLTAAMFLLGKTVQADYVNISTFGSENFAQNELFGSSIALASNSSTLVVAAGIPYRAQPPPVQIFKSSNNGKNWAFSQNILCCPIPPNINNAGFILTPFAVAFSDNGEFLLIGKPGSSGPDTEVVGATLYSVLPNGTYVDTLVDVTSSYFPLATGMSVALSGDGSHAFVGTYDAPNSIGIVSWTEVVKFNVKPLNLPGSGSSPYSLATNTDGSTLIVGTGSKVFVYTAFSYKTNVVSATILPTLGETKTFGLSVSLTRDGSIFAIGSCGYGVYIYSSSNFVTPNQILTLPNETYFGCNVTLSSDGKKLVVGSQNNLTLSNGYAYGYRGSAGFFSLESKIVPPTFDLSNGGGGVAVVNKVLDYGIVLVGGPKVGKTGLGSGQIAVFESVPTASASATATASASSTFSAIATPSSSNTFSAFSSASSTRTSTATMTATSSMTATMTSSPSASASSSVTSTMTATSTQTLTSTSTSSSSASATATATSTSTSSSSASATATATSTSSSSATASASATATGTNTATGTATSTRTSTPSTTQSMTSTTTATPSTSIIPLAANSTPFIITVSLASTGGVIVLVGLGYFLLSWLRKPPAGPTKALFPVEVTQNSPWHVVSGSGSGSGSGGEVSSLLGAKSVNSYTAVSEGDIGDTYRALSVAEGAGGVKGGASRKQRVISLL
jgi:hypothetical protein